MTTRKLDKNEIVTRRAPRWAWQAIDMLLAGTPEQALPYKALQRASQDPLATVMPPDLVKYQIYKERHRQ